MTVPNLLNIVITLHGLFVFLNWSESAIRIHISPLF